VGVTADRSQVTVGDKVTVTVTAVAREGIAVALPSKLEVGRFELVERAEDPPGGQDIGNGRRTFRFRLVVTSYEPGELELPSLVLSWTDDQGEVRALQTRPLTLNVRSVLPPDDAPDLDIAGALPPREVWVEDTRVSSLLFGLGGLLGALLLLFGARRLVRRRRPAGLAESAAPVVVRDPGEVALERLAALRAAGGFEREGYRPFAFALAELVRAYLGGRFGFDALELTSTELLEALRQRAPHLLGPEAELPRFVEESDLIKFASAGGSLGLAEALIQMAERIVRLPVPPPPTGVAPTSVAPAGVASAGVVPTGVAPAGVASAGVAPAGVAPAGVAPTGVVPSPPALSDVTAEPSAAPGEPALSSTATHDPDRGAG
jgi:hypothetical protein